MTKDEALDVLRELHDKAPLFEKGALETYIPELKYSKDELIRKSLLIYFSKTATKWFAGSKREDIVAWLKKQREHKFERGDIISNGEMQYRIVGMGKNCIGDDCYSLVTTRIESEKPFLWICEEVDRLFERL